MQHARIYNKGDLIRNEDKECVAIAPVANGINDLLREVLSNEDEIRTFIQSKSEKDYNSRESENEDSEETLLMSMTELRSYKDFSNFKDDEAREYINTMQQFCTLTFELFMQKK